MILVGGSWLLFWAMIEVADVAMLTAALVTGAVFVIVGLVQGERPFMERR